MKKNVFFAILFVLAFVASGCIDPQPTVSPIVTPTPFQSPLVPGAKDQGPRVPIEGPFPVEEDIFVDIINQFWNVVIEAVSAPQLHTLLGLILLNLAAAVTDAIVNKRFEWERLADFYRTQVLPYAWTYFCLYIVIAYIPGIEDLPGAEKGLQWFALAKPTATLWAKFLGHLRGLGLLGGSD